MSWGDRVLGVFCVLGIIWLASIFTATHHEYHEYCDIYKATVPFGEFVQTGRLGGFMFFGFGSVGGSLSGEEFYLVKYFDGEELKTLKLDADETSLIVDGTLQLEIISTYSSGRHFFVFDWVEKPHRDSYPEYRIHIPYLPEVNQIMKEGWTK